MSNITLCYVINIIFRLTFFFKFWSTYDEVSHSAFTVRDTAQETSFVITRQPHTQLLTVNHLASLDNDISQCHQLISLADWRNNLHFCQGAPRRMLFIISWHHLMRQLGLFVSFRFWQIWEYFRCSKWMKTMFLECKIISLTLYFSGLFLPVAAKNEITQGSLKLHLI